MKRYVWGLLLLAAVFVSGCGSTSETPRIVMVIDALDQNISTTTTGIIPTKFVVQTNAMMSLTSAQAAGAITLVCGDLPAAGFTVARDVANTLLAITVTDAWRYSHMGCTLTFTTALTTDDGTPLAEPVSYAFTNACAVNDDFNADSSGCWTPYDVDGFVQIDWSSLADLLTFDISNSSLDADFIGSTRQIILQKTAGTSSDAFEMEIMIEDPVNITEGGDGHPPSTIMAILADSAQISMVSKQIGVGLAGDEGTTYCTILAYLTNEEPTAGYRAPCTSTTETYYIKYSTLSGAPTFQYKVGSGPYVDMTEQTGEWPTSWSFSGADNNSLALYFGARNNETGKVGYISTQGIASSSQY